MEFVANKLSKYKALGVVRHVLFLCVLLISLSSVSFAAVYNVGTAAQLKEVSDRVAGGYTYAGDTINITANINLNGSSTNQWVPIGGATYPFDGIFEGNDHIISGIYIDRTADYNGLFGKASTPSEIRNINVSGYVKGGNYSAGLVGYSNGRVEACKNACNVTNNGGKNSIGGIAGMYNNGKILNCRNTGTITGYQYTGGICGQGVCSEEIVDCNNTGKIVSTYPYAGGIVGTGVLVNNCYNTGTITAKQDYVGGIAGSLTTGITKSYNQGTIIVTGDRASIGGIAGRVNGIGCFIEECYNEGDINTGNGKNVGGIVGNFYADLYTRGRIEKSYNLGTISGSSSVSASLYGVGGIVGSLSYCNIKNVYNLGTINGSDNANTGGISGYSMGMDMDYAYNAGTVGGGSPLFNGTASAAYTYLYYLEGISTRNSNNGTIKTVTQLRDPSMITLLNTNQTSVWKVGDERTSYYPTLVMEEFETEVESVYEIWNVEDLIEFSTNVNNGIDYNNSVVYLMKDIDFAGNSTNMFTPIGDQTKVFQGTFEGNGHTISNIYINQNADYCGFFGQIGSGAKVQNLTVTGTVIGGNNTGGIVGYNGNGKILNIISYINVSANGSKSNVGGIVGNNKGILQSCKNYGTIIGYQYTGGIVGDSSSSYPIMNCNNFGNIQTTYTYTGGIVGTGVLVNNCYNTGTITAKQDYVGGIAGSLTTGITKSYNQGTIIVTGDRANIGGIAGRVNGAGCFIEECYNEGDINTGNGKNVGGIVGNFYADLNTRGRIEKSYNLGTISGSSSVSGSLYGVGGIVGSLSYCNIKNVYNIGTINGSGNVNTGGISGYSMGMDMDYAYNAGTVGSGCPLFNGTASAAYTYLYYLEGISTRNSDNGVMKTINELQNSSIISSLNINQSSVWKMGGERNKYLPELVLDSINSDVSSLYEINSLQELIDFSTSVKNGKNYASDKVSLMVDISLNPSITNNIEPIGNISNQFAGTFDGNGHTISGININLAQDNVGLFCAITGGATIKNLTVDGIVMGNSNVGGLVGYNAAGTIKNCISYIDVSTKSYGKYVGGIAGISKSGQINSCQNFGEINGYEYTGGISGISDGINTIIYSSNFGTVTSNYTYIGGITSVGGLITNSYNIGTITAKQDYVGGIAGSLTTGITKSYNQGTIIVTGDRASIGGIAGRVNGIGCFIEECYNEGDINTGNGKNVGGIVGNFYADLYTRGRIEKSYNLGTISGSSSVSASLYGVGGIVGSLSYCNIKNVYNLGTINGSDNANTGGISGYSMGMDMDYAYNAGTVGGGSPLFNGTASAAYTYLYYLEGISTRNSDNGVVKTVAELRNPAMLTPLNTNQNPPVWSMPPNYDINRGFPMFEFYPGESPLITDGVPPTISFSPNGNKLGGQSVEDSYTKTYFSKITVVDNNGGDGVDSSSIRYALTQSEEQPADGELTYTFAENTFEKTVNFVNKSGLWYIWVKASDVNGNTTYARSNPFYLDAVPPEGTILIGPASAGQQVVEVAGEKYTNDNTVNLFISAIDNVSSVDKITVAFFNADTDDAYDQIRETDLTWENFSMNKIWNLNPGEGERIVYIVLKDKAGNQTTYFIDTP